MSVPKAGKSLGAISIGALITAIVSLVGIALVLYAFVNTASPYGTFSDARKSKSDSIHVAGDLVKETVHMDMNKGSINFDLKDSAGEKVSVVYNGPPPANMADATKVVAIGGMQADGRFHSSKLLIKCPSKYEGQKVGGKPS